MACYRDSFAFLRFVIFPCINMATIIVFWSIFLQFATILKSIYFSLLLLHLRSIALFCSYIHQLRLMTELASCFSHNVLFHHADAAIRC
jgi:hypothetical protein